MGRKKATDRTEFKIPQECIDMIVEGIGAIKTTAQIARDVEREYGITYSAAYGRVKSVWKALEREAGLDAKIERAKVSQALLQIYREAAQDMSLERCIETLNKADMPREQIWRILNKWDPYKGATVAMKALEQYTKLHGLNAPERVDVHTTHEAANPLTMTPQEKTKRIAELLAQREIQPPVSKAGKKDMN